MIYLAVICGALCALAVIGFIAAATAAEKRRLEEEDAIPLKESDYET